MPSAGHICKERGAARLVKRQHRYPGLKVVFLTASPNIDSCLQSVCVGHRNRCARVLNKNHDPTSNYSILHRFQSVLPKRPANDTLVWLLVMFNFTIHCADRGQRQQGRSQEMAHVHPSPIIRYHGRHRDNNSNH